MASKTEINRVREILLRYWDPLGVGDNPNLADEYDSYLGRILQLVDKDCSNEQLEAHLLELEIALDARGPDENRKIVAEQLLSSKLQ